jgi:hypothetical protein
MQKGPMADRPNSGGISEKFFNYVSQMAHWATMSCWSLTLALFFGFSGVIVSNVLGIAYAAWHEFYWDPRHENAETRGSNIEDFLFLLLGLAIGDVVYATALIFGRLRS